ncbi:NAD-dependent epimerase/dehydratase family protein [Caldalkalibacillus salinus]|uniref:NAD-dependent epimerase/dehydratase family protein n=1 Tax=Caldalkalibacillus salinus TaxID=2803787 RepID=UPI001920C648|nr:NAD-dependent epimerase/dehydratase family protein [Caldalkalibacillus salinus]
MKRILITGKNSYVGTSLKDWLNKYPDRYSVDTISLRDDTWKKKDLSGYDGVFHVAGIAHIKETKENADLYYKVNRDLAYEVAQKARVDGVKQFIFLSSMSVYGIEIGIIDKDTPAKPISNYGKSKLEAEELIKSLEGTGFKVAIIRPPMIYGKGCKGNYPRLANLALKVPFFPSIENKRSMIYIDNLCEFIRLLIDEASNGIFFPQNNEYVCTSEMVRLIAEIHGKEIRMIKLFNPILRLSRSSTINKVFGDLVYDMNISNGIHNYNCYLLKESISKSELS